jgi:competence protein ComEA
MAEVIPPPASPETVDPLVAFGTDVSSQAIPRETPDSDESPAIRSAQAEAAPSQEDAAPLWLRRGDQAVVATLVALGLVFLSLHAWRAGVFHGEVVDIERLPSTAIRYRLDVNRATWVEWSQLDGIGETLARRIVADRDAHGPFRSLEDLSRVKGIGPRTLDKMRPWLRLKEERASPAP